MTIRLMATGKVYEVTEVGVFKPALVNVEELGEGMVGFLAASIKNVRDARVGDTITDENHPAAKALPGYRKATPMVYCGLYPVENSDYDNLRDALENCSSTMLPSCLSRKLPPPWGLASAAVFGAPSHGCHQGTAGKRI